MTENERLKMIRDSLGLTQRTFSEGLEIKQGSYSDVERGKAGISALLLKNLIRKYRVNPLWLCEGEGEMFIGLEGLKSQVNSLSYTEEEYKFREEKDNSTSLDSNIEMLERQQQYIECVKGIVDFLD